jgi:hypothetical protein
MHMATRAHAHEMPHSMTAAVTAGMGERLLGKDACSNRPRQTASVCKQPRCKQAHIREPLTVSTVTQTPSQAEHRSSWPVLGPDSTQPPRTARMGLHARMQARRRAWQPEQPQAWFGSTQAICLRCDHMWVNLTGQRCPPPPPTAHQTPCRHLQVASAATLAEAERLSNIHAVILHPRCPTAAPAAHMHSAHTLLAAARAWRPRLTPLASTCA